MRLTLQRPIRYLITAGSSTPDNFNEQREVMLRTICNAVAVGIELVQLREKRLTPKLLFQLSCDAAAITAGSSTRLFVNDRFDIALAAGADGVHLTSNSLPARIVRQRTPDNFVIAVSTHTKNEVIRAKNDGADLVVYGPVFFSPDKGEPKGAEDLRNVCAAAADLPVLALGGIDEQNARIALESGAAGYAAIRSLNDFVNIKQ